MNRLRWIVKTVGGWSIVKFFEASTNFLHLPELKESVWNHGKRRRRRFTFRIYIYSLLSGCQLWHNSPELPSHCWLVGYPNWDRASNQTCPTNADIDCRWLENEVGLRISDEPMSILWLVYPIYCARGILTIIKARIGKRVRIKTHAGRPKIALSCIPSIQNRRNSWASSWRPCLMCLAISVYHSKSQLKSCVGRLQWNRNTF